LRRGLGLEMVAPLLDASLLQQAPGLLLWVAGGWVAARSTADTKPQAGSSSNSDKKGPTRRRRAIKILRSLLLVTT